MPRKMPRRGSSAGRGRSRPRFHWAGFFMEGATTPGDALVDAFTLYDPQTSDIHAGSTVHRIIGHLRIRNPATAGNSDFGAGIGVLAVDDGSGIVHDLDLIEGADHSHETIGDTAWLWRQFGFLQALVATSGYGYRDFPIDVRVKRRIASQKELLAFVIQGNVASRWEYHFWARALLTEGR